MNKQQKIAAAEEFLNATQISPQRWRYKDDAMSAYYIVSMADMVFLGEMLDYRDHHVCPSDYGDYGRCDDDCHDVYSHWCASTSAREDRNV